MERGEFNPSHKPVVLIDMDDVMTDFYGAASRRIPEAQRVPRTQFYVEHNYPEHLHDTIEQTYLEAGFFKSLEPLPGLLEGWQTLIDHGFHPRVNTSPIERNPTCRVDKLDWLNRVMAPAFGPSVASEAIIDSNKWRYNGIALLDDRPIIPKIDTSIHGAQPARWEHILFGWNSATTDILADTALRLVSWNEVDSILPILDTLASEATTQRMQ